MQDPIGIPLDVKRMLYKALFFIGILIILYALLLILAKLDIIPSILYTLFPQMVLLIIGILLVYLAMSKRKEY